MDLQVQEIHLWCTLTVLLHRIFYPKYFEFYEYFEFLDFLLLDYEAVWRSQGKFGPFVCQPCKKDLDSTLVSSRKKQQQ